MKKYLLLITAAVIIVNCLFLSSCKKSTTHYPHPSPGGIRLSSYSMVINSTHHIAFTSDTHENDNYSFTYDTLNRLSYEVFTTNNPTKPNENITFAYSNDTVYKTITSVTPSILIEKDTFIFNSQGQLSLAFTPNTITSFQYYENLLTYAITTTSVPFAAVTTTYTSIVGNFINGNSSLSPVNNQTFTYYTDYTNRMGDYLQTLSFTMYGYNVYQYTNLVHTIFQAAHTTTASYGIDAYSDVTSSNVSVADALGDDSTIAYSFQYQNY